jgi:hypothetical protein
MGTPLAYLHQGVGDLVVDLLRGGVDVVDAIEGEGLGRGGAVVGVDQRARAALRVHQDHVLHRGEGAVKEDAIIEKYKRENVR